MKNAVFWNVAPCRYLVNRRFGGTYRCSHLLTLVHRSRISYTMKMEAIRSCETSVNTISTRRHIPEDGIFHSHRRENLKFYIYTACSNLLKHLAYKNVKIILK
jgi:hypothetical protein